MIGAELPGCLLAYLLRRLRILRHGSQAGWQGLRLGLLAVVPNGHAQAERRDCGDAKGDDDALQADSAKPTNKRGLALGATVRS
jgi:hypothetical protein